MVHMAKIIYIITWRNCR